MDLYIPFSILLIIWCYTERHNLKRVRGIFFGGLIITCIFAAIRYEFGPDYFNYRAIYYGIQGESIEEYGGKGQSVEKPFLYLLSIFPSFTLFVVVLTVTWFAANIYLFNKYIPNRFYWILVMFLFYNATYLLASFVSMRTTICATLFIVALTFLLRGKRLYYAAIIILASMFHTSAIALILFTFLRKNNNSFIFSTPVVLVMGGIAIFSVLVGGNVLVESAVTFLVDNVSELERYSEREVGNTSQSVFTFIYKLMSLAIMLYLAKGGSTEKDPRFVIMYKIGVIAALIQLFFGQNIISDRYMNILNPVYIIVVFRSMLKNNIKVNSVIILFIMVSCFYIFFQKLGKSYSRSFMEYHSILSAPIIP